MNWTPISMILLPREVISWTLLSTTSSLIPLSYSFVIQILSSNSLSREVCWLVLESSALDALLSSMN